MTARPFWHVLEPLSIILVTTAVLHFTGTPINASTTCALLTGTIYGWWYRCYKTPARAALKGGDA